MLLFLLNIYRPADTGYYKWKKTLQDEGKT